VGGGSDEEGSSLTLAPTVEKVLLGGGAGWGTRLTSGGDRVRATEQEEAGPAVQPKQWQRAVASGWRCGSGQGTAAGISRARGAAVTVGCGSDGGDGGVVEVPKVVGVAVAGGGVLNGGIVCKCGL
jgi:hypothetical protein